MEHMPPAQPWTAPPALSDAGLVQILVDLDETLRLLFAQLRLLQQALHRTNHGGLGRGGMSPADYDAWRQAGPYE